jgi:L-fuculose-phosphate aldolase
LLAAGKNLKETIKIAFICEKSAHATLLAANIGGAIELSKEECDIMRDFYLNKYGQR